MEILLVSFGSLENETIKYPLIDVLMACWCIGHPFMVNRGALLNISKNLWESILYVIHF